MLGDLCRSCIIQEEKSKDTKMIRPARILTTLLYCPLNNEITVDLDYSCGLKANVMALPCAVTRGADKIDD